MKFQGVLILLALAIALAIGLGFGSPGKAGDFYLPNPILAAAGAVLFFLGSFWPFIDQLKNGENE